MTEITDKIIKSLDRIDEIYDCKIWARPSYSVYHQIKGIITLSREILTEEEFKEMTGEFKSRLEMYSPSSWEEEE